MYPRGEMDADREDRRHSIPFILNRAEAILRRQGVDPVRLQPEKTFGENPNKRGSVVVRAKVVEGAADLGDSLIVKKVREKGNKGGDYLPGSAALANGAHGFFNDWAALEFFARLSNSPLLLPRFFGGDREAGVLVMEDLGEGVGTSLTAALQGRDARLAEAAMLEYAQALGGLHASSVGRADAYYQIRDRLGPRPELPPLYTSPWLDARGRASSAAEVDGAVAAYRRVFSRLGSVGNEVRRG